MYWRAQEAIASQGSCAHGLPSFPRTTPLGIFFGGSVVAAAPAAVDSAASFGLPSSAMAASTGWLCLLVRRDGGVAPESRC